MKINERQSKTSAAPAASVAAWSPADCLGKRGLPAVRADLDALVEDLCCRVRAAGETGLRGRQLAAEMKLSGTRALRLLVAYAQIAKGRREIVGVPGSGYSWGPAAPDARRRMADHARKMGRDWFAKASVYQNAPGKQLALEFVNALPNKRLETLKNPGKFTCGPLGRAGE